MDFLAVNNFGDTRSGGLAGPMGLFIIVVLSIATVLLIRNMNKRLRRLPDSFEPDSGSGRDREISRSGAAVRAAETAPDRPEVDGSRSSARDAAVQAQVNDPAVQDRPAAAAAGSDVA